MNKLACLLICASFAAAASESYTLHESARSGADAYSRAAQLQPLQAAGPDELRVWMLDYMGGHVTGYIASRHRATKCLTKYHYADELVTIDDARCWRVWRWVTKQEAIDLLGTLAELDGKEWNCPRLDGGGVIVDGVHDGKRITLEVGNPDACDDPASRAVMKLLRALP